MKLEAAVLNYWKMSQHMRAIPVSEREAFRVLVIGPASVQNPLLCRLLSAPEAATG